MSLRKLASSFAPRKSQKGSSSQNPGSSSKNPGSSSSSQQDPNTYQIKFENDSQRKKYESLEKRGMGPTRFYHEHTCNCLHIKEKVDEFAADLGWGNFISNTVIDGKAPLTYVQPTLEFLSSFSLFTTENGGEKELNCKFRLFNKPHKLSLRRLNQFFGWDPDATLTDVVHTLQSGYKENDWWAMITDGSTRFQTRSSKASEIQHPALRYLHRLMVYALFSKDELGKLTKEEIHLLWRAAIAKYDLEVEEVPLVNFGHLLLRRFEEIRNGERHKGKIHIGGMITWIAFKLGHYAELSVLTALDDDPYFDLERMRIAGMLRSAVAPPRTPALERLERAERDPFRQVDMREHSGALRRPWVWLVKEVPWCYIPHPFIISPGEVENPFRIPMEELNPRELSARERDQRERHQQQQHQQQRQQARRSHHGGTTQQPLQPGRHSFHMGSSSRAHQEPPRSSFHHGSSSDFPSQSGGGMYSPSMHGFDIERAFENLNLRISEVGQRDPSPSVYESQIYDWHVNRGDIAPPVNYPYHPPQQGPVPCWDEVTLDSDGVPIPRSNPTYPYWQGPPPHEHSFPPYDYRLSGGCDYSGDPAYPYVNPEPAPIAAPMYEWQYDLFQNHGFPPGYHGGWDSARDPGPPIEVDYQWRPWEPTCPDPPPVDYTIDDGRRSWWAPPDDPLEED